MTSFFVLGILKIFLASSLINGLFPTPTQTRTFTSKSVDYVVEFPSTKWKALRSSSIVSARTRKEFTYANAKSVRLFIRRKLVDSNVSPSDMVQRRQNWDQQLTGYVLIKEEDFQGRLKGAKFFYEYIQSGRPMTAVIYYLEADNRTIYSLLFTGTRDEQQVILDQSDSIARSFRLK